MPAMKSAKPLCCVAMDMVIAQSRPSDRTGLQLALSLRGTSLVVAFHKIKDGPHKGASFCLVNYCPFCGKEVERA